MKELPKVGARFRIRVRRGDIIDGKRGMNSNYPHRCPIEIAATRYFGQDIHAGFSSLQNPYATWSARAVNIQRMHNFTHENDRPDGFLANYGEETSFTFEVVKD